MSTGAKKSVRCTAAVLAVLCAAMLVGCAPPAPQTASDSALPERNAASRSSASSAAVPEQVQPQLEEHIADFSAQFEGLSGCAVLSSTPGVNTLYKPEQCKRAVSPYSTFKIVSALIGLEQGIVTGKDSRMQYSGAQYPLAAWNGDLSLQEAFGTSCVWYFRQIIDTAGQEAVAQTLHTLQYGNCDISQWEGAQQNPMKDLNGFWLDSSLQISPLQQVQVLQAVFGEDSPYPAELRTVLQQMMALPAADGQPPLYGKTGSSPNGQAWFVGFAEREGGKQYIAVYLEDAAQREAVSGEKAKEIARALLDLA